MFDYRCILDPRGQVSRENDLQLSYCEVCSSNKTCRHSGLFLNMLSRVNEIDMRKVQLYLVRKYNRAIPNSGYCENFSRSFNQA